MSSYARKILRYVILPFNIWLAIFCNTLHVGSAGEPRIPSLTTVSALMLSFNVHGILYIGDDEQTAPVEQEIRDLSAGLQMVKDEQAYLVVRERVHRDSELPLQPCTGLC